MIPSLPCRIAPLILLAACGARVETAEVSPSIEDLTPTGAPYTSSTQSFLRHHHWLEGVDSVEIHVDADARGRLRLTDSGSDGALDVVELDMRALMPRLHYTPASPPDAFDAFNLMMAEFSRNGLSVPTGSPGDTIAHFETDRDASHPWSLDGPYAFRPEPDYRPLRFGVVNNCLDATKWELNAVDRAGELYHAWFTFPEALYLDLVAETNGLEPDFVAGALPWRTDAVPPVFDRLRDVESVVADVEVEVVDGPVGYSSQDSRRKLSKGFVKVETPEGLVLPERFSDFAEHTLQMSDFSDRGKYRIDTRKPFDLAFLYEATGARIATVTPKTAYGFHGADATIDFAGETHLEIALDLGERQLVLGNLPMPLLVQQIEFAMHGFGVGILPAGDLAERRALLLEGGPHPSYAYLLEQRGGEVVAINSHDVGVEQIFIRTHPGGDAPHWEIVVTSFERIVDLVRYRVPIPPALLDEARGHTERFISPIYLTYRDDNIR